MLGQEEEARALLGAVQRVEEARANAELTLLVSRWFLPPITRRSRSQDCRHFAERWLAEAPQCRAARLVLAESLFRLEEWRLAGEHVLLLLSSDPRDVEALHLRGLLSYHQEQWQKAAEVLLGSSCSRPGVASSAPAGP